MALVSSLFTAISGMRNHQTLLDVISNNVANVNTVGFKAGRVQFRDLLSQTIQGANGSNSATNRGGTNPIQFGAGVSVASIDTLQRQGTFQATGNATDMAINGDGFFISKAGTEQTFTRAGSFRFDSLGRLVDPSGGLIQGWSAAISQTDPLARMTINATNPANIGNITITPGQTLQAHETQNVKLVGNLDAGANATNLANSAGEAGTRQLTVLDNANGSTTYTVGTTAMTFNVYDSLGNSHQLTGTLTNLSNTQIPEATPGQVYDNNTWAWTVDTDPSDTTVHLALDNSTYTDPVSGQLVRASSSGMLHFLNNGALDWVTYADRNAEHFGTHWDQLSANDTNVPGGNILPAAPVPPIFGGLQNPGEAPIFGAGGSDLSVADFWADAADEDVHNTTVIGFEGAIVPAGDFTGASDLSNPGAVGNPAPGDNQLFDNPGVTQTGGGPPAPAQDVFALLKLPIVLCYQNIPAGSPIPPASTTAGTLVSMDIAGRSAAFTPPANAVQQWFVQKFDIDWGSVSTITQADFDRNIDPPNAATNETGGPSALPALVSTGDGEMDGMHADLAAGIGGQFNAFGDRRSDLEMPWDPRVVRTTLGQRDGLTQDASGHFENVNGVNVYKTAFTARLDSQDGYSQGVLQSVSVDASGKITGVFNTVQGASVNQELAQVAIATFTNPAGLAKSGDTHFTETANSGSAIIGQALTNGAGSVVGGVVEQSNVDLSEELTNMIVAQRGFEANARLISTSDKILDTLVNLGR